MTKDIKLKPADIPEGISPTIVGLSFLVSSFLSAFVAAYLAVQGSVDKWIESQKEIQLLEIQVRREQNAKEVNTIHEMQSMFSELHDNSVLQGQDLRHELERERQKTKELEARLKSRNPKTN